MNGPISILLDVFRFLAAMGVFLLHAHQHAAAVGVLPPVPIAHKLVIVFFVISGYVIAASASRPDRKLANYSADRLARLSSVVIPALFLTYSLDFIGARISPELYSSIDHRGEPLRFLVNFFYCQQVWFVCVNPSSNSPFWSLSYEFWYYVLFGVCLFVRRKWIKIILLLAVSAFVGPKILLLLPTWAVGAIAFHASRSWRCSYRISLVLFGATGLATIVAVFFGDWVGLKNFENVPPPLYYSSNYWGDNAFAVIVASHFLGCALLSMHFTGNLERYSIVKFIRWASSHTFSLYVYHLPLLYFIRAIANYDPHSMFAVLSAMCIALLTIAWLSKVTEERYPSLRTLLRRRFGAFAPKSDGACAAAHSVCASNTIPKMSCTRKQSSDRV